VLDLSSKNKIYLGFRSNACLWYIRGIKPASVPVLVKAPVVLLSGALFLIAFDKI